MQKLLADVWLRYLQDGDVFIAVDVQRDYDLWNLYLGTPWVESAMAV